MLHKSLKSRLRIVEENISGDDIKLLVRWRKKNNFAYAEQPKVTFSSMKWWFEEHYLKQRKVLFWVIGNKGEKIGHMGIVFYNDFAEIDNVSRGEEKYKGIMSEALQELTKIAKRIYPIIQLKVLADNEHAIRFYERNGFRREGMVLYKNKLFVKMYENSYKHGLV